MSSCMLGYKKVTYRGDDIRGNDVYGSMTQVR